jgi:excisionase family DNA binding protein
MKQQTNIETELKEIKQLLTVQTDEPMPLSEAYKYLGIKKSYLYKLIFLKQISFYKPNGKLIFFKKNDLNNWLFRGRHKSKAEIETEAGAYLNKGVQHTNSKQGVYQGAENNQSKKGGLQ